MLSEKEKPTKTTYINKLKSEPYLRLKNSKRTSKYSLLQHPKFFLNKSHNAKKNGRGTLREFQHPFCRKTTKKLKGSIQKFSKKSFIVQKKNRKNTKIRMFSRFWTSFFFVLDEVPKFRVFLNLSSSVQVVEQMNKKVELARLKTLPTVRVGR